MPNRIGLQAWIPSKPEAKRIDPPIRQSPICDPIELDSGEKKSDTKQLDCFIDQQRDAQQRKQLEYQQPQFAETIQEKINEIKEKNLKLIGIIQKEYPDAFKKALSNDPRIVNEGICLLDDFFRNDGYDCDPLLIEGGNEYDPNSLFPLIIGRSLIALKSQITNLSKEDKVRLNPLYQRTNYYLKNSRLALQLVQGDFYAVGKETLQDQIAKLSKTSPDLALIFSVFLQGLRVVDMLKNPFANIAETLGDKYLSKTMAFSFSRQILSLSTDLGYRYKKEDLDAVSLAVSENLIRYFSRKLGRKIDRQLEQINPNYNLWGLLKNGVYSAYKTWINPDKKPSLRSYTGRKLLTLDEGTNENEIQRSATREPIDWDAFDKKLRKALSPPPEKVYFIKHTYSKETKKAIYDEMFNTIQKLAKSDPDVAERLNVFLSHPRARIVVYSEKDRKAFIHRVGFGSDDAESTYTIAGYLHMPRAKKMIPIVVFTADDINDIKQNQALPGSIRHEFTHGVLDIYRNDFDSTYFRAKGMKFSQIPVPLFSSSEDLKSGKKCVRTLRNYMKWVGQQARGRRLTRKKRDAVARIAGILNQNTYDLIFQQGMKYGDAKRYEKKVGIPLMKNDILKLEVVSVYLNKETNEGRVNVHLKNKAMTPHKFLEILDLYPAFRKTAELLAMLNEYFDSKTIRLLCSEVEEQKEGWKKQYPVMKEDEKKWFERKSDGLNEL